MGFVSNNLWKLLLLLFLVFFPRLTFGLEVSDLNSVESRAIHLACPQVSSEDLCIRKHLYALSKVKRIKLDPLNEYNRLALKSICETESELSKGPAIYNRCLEQELRSWAASDKVLLSKMSESNQVELVEVCQSEINEGLVKFHQCLVFALQNRILKNDPGGKSNQDPGSKQVQLPSTSSPLNSQQLYEMLSPSVLMVGAWERNGKLGTTGSGVAVSKFLILTNYHVVEGRDYFRVKNGQFDERATIYWSEPDGDMCILRVGVGRLIPVRDFRIYDEIKIGEKVYTLGSPSGLENTFAEGLLSGKRTKDGRNYLQTTAAISPGSSGGGLFDAEGQLIGITTFHLEGNDLFFAIPIDSFPSEIRKIN